MHGWLIAKKRNDINYSFRKEYIEDVFITSNFIIWSKKHPKFINDQIIKISEERILITYGLLLNLKDYKKQNSSLSDKLISDFIFDYKSTLKSFRGHYSGFFYDSSTNNTIVFTNRIGDKPVYYYNNNAHFIVSSNLNALVDFCHSSNIILSADIIAIKEFLQFGFQIDKKTKIKEISRLMPGQNIVYNENIVVENYHTLSAKKNNDDLNKIIDNIDILFRQAIVRDFEKDLEYGYKHLVDISAGMDSRILNWIAHDLGYTNIMNISYSIPNSIDFKIASKISSILKNRFLFLSLSDGMFISDVDESTKRNYGSATYIGPTGTLSLINNLNLSNIGIRHNGNVGAPPFGSYLKSFSDEKPGNLGVGYSRLNFNIEVKELDRYETSEIHKMYIRSYLGVLSSHLLSEDSLISLSPFLDSDFVEYLMSIPNRLRYNNYIYKKWITKKYPNVAEIPWNSRFFKIKHNKKRAQFIKSSIRKSLDYFNYALYYLKIRKFKHRMTGMNPINAIIERNPILLNFINDYYSKNIHLVFENYELKKLIDFEFVQGNWFEKTLAIQILSFIKIYNLDVKNK